MVIKAADMLIARRADTRARADFATWKMLAKLNGASALPTDAQNFLASYKTLLETMRDAEASEATIKLMYNAYYIEMGGAGTPPRCPARVREPVADAKCTRPPPPRQAEDRSLRTEREAAAACGIDLRLPCRGLRRDPLLLALTAGASTAFGTASSFIQSFHSSSPGLTGRSSIPETLVFQPRSRGVLDHPHARVMTASMWRLRCHFQT